MEKFEPVLKGYEHWDLLLAHQCYPYIGRCKAWAKREEADHLTDMSKAERDELFDVILPEYKRAVTELFNPYRINLAIFGNTVRHLHAHFIPRYEEEKEFYGITFVDPNPYGNYAPYPKKQLERDVILKIAEDIKSSLPV